jgi:hypothetical protein
VPDRGGRHYTGGINGKAKTLELREVSDAAIDDSPSETARVHGSTHEASHARYILPILNLHHIDVVFMAAVDRGKHAIECVWIIVFLFHELHGERCAYELGREDGLHAMGQIALFMQNLFHGIGHRGDFNLSESVEERWLIVFVIGRCDGGLSPQGVAYAGKEADSDDSSCYPCRYLRVHKVPPLF